MCNDKPSSIDGLRYLIGKKIDVVAVVGPPREKPSLGGTKIIDVANQLGLETTTDDELYRQINLGNKSKIKQSLESIDLVISFKFWKKIKKPLIHLPKIGCINFHPYPLPEFKGLGGYVFGIYQNIPYWGVSAHFVDEDFDTGDIIKVVKFDIDPKKETSYSLEQKSQKFLLELFKEVMDTANTTGSLPRKKQEGKGRYYSRQDLIKLQNITQNDSLEDIEKKIRALWFPPHSGACIEIKGKKFTLVNEEILKEIGKKYHG